MRRSGTGFDYDALNRLTRITNALAGITQYAYNGVDQLISFTDPKSLLTSDDANGNRASHKVGATNYAYTKPTTSKRLILFRVL